ncbi:MAG: hypothetical protein KAW47_06970 [Thermoplasmatales archaeon]|nr:hypothetical protein [Thermoplasmatales archaeon]
MNRIQFLNRKAVIASIFTVVVMCLASTAVPIVQGSEIIDKQTGIKNTYNKNEGFLSNNIFDIFRERSNIIENIQHVIEEMYLKISDGDIENNEENTDDYYNYRTLYYIFKILTLNMDYQNWITASSLISFIGFIDIIIAIILVAMGAIDVGDALLFGLLTGLVPIAYSESVFRMGSRLTGQAIDMSFHIIDESGEPVNGLKIIAEPLDNNGLFKFPVFEAEQKENMSGWYFIPKKHSSPMVDAPPGIHHVTIEENNSEVLMEFNTTPIPSGERYGIDIIL